MKTTARDCPSVAPVAVPAGSVPAAGGRVFPCAWCEKNGRTPRYKVHGQWTATMPDGCVPDECSHAICPECFLIEVDLISAAAARMD